MPLAHELRSQVPLVVQSLHQPQSLRSQLAYLLCRYLRCQRWFQYDDFLKFPKLQLLHHPTLAGLSFWVSHASFFHPHQAHQLPAGILLEYQATPLAVHGQTKYYFAH